MGKKGFVRRAPILAVTAYNYDPASKKSAFRNSRELTNKTVWHVMHNGIYIAAYTFIAILISHERFVCTVRPIIYIYIGGMYISDLYILYITTSVNLG